jgi:hypothetical protein
VSSHLFPFSRRAFFTPEQASRGNKAWTRNALMDNTARPMSPALRAGKLVFTGLLLCISGIAFGQTNILQQGGEYSVGGAFAGNQVQPSIALGPNGGLVVCEDNAADPSGLGIHARRLDAALSPVGDLFRVNQSLAGDQACPRVALLSDGGAVVVWEGELPGPKKGVRGQRNVYARFLAADGAFQTDEILVNLPAFALNHRITTNWTLIRNNKARPRTQRIREIVNNREEFNLNPGVVTLTDGSVVVVYSSSRKMSVKSFGLSETLRWDYKRSLFVTNRTRVPVNLAFDYMSDIYAQRFSATGVKLGDEFVVNGMRDFNQRNASVAALSNGGFVVCWINEVPSIESTVSASNNVVTHRGGHVDVFARVFGSDGTPSGAEFRVSTASWPSGGPVIAGSSDGGFTVAWVQRDSVKANGLDIWFRSFEASATAAGDPARANDQLHGDQFAPAITTIGNRHLLVWSSMGQDGSWEGVYARLLRGGALADDEFRVNTTKYLRQINPATASSGAGAVVVWSSYGFDTGFDLFGQRYQAP